MCHIRLKVNYQSSTRSHSFNCSIKIYTKLTIIDRENKMWIILENEKKNKEYIKTYVKTVTKWNSPEKDDKGGPENCVGDRTCF